MALRSKSIDEETDELTDIYDGLIAPKKVWRNHNNKLYLILRSFAAGKIGIVDTALALRNRFNPQYCEELDLYSTAKIVGTDYKKGTGSIVYITIKNKSVIDQKILQEGIYNYQSSLGMIFYFQLSNDAIFEPEEERVVAAISQEKGSFQVTSNADIKLFRSDGKRIDAAFVFSCGDNSDRLGYADETPYDFRVRILNDTNRQDHLKELELKIRNLPNIFECNLVLNEDTSPQEYDGITLAGKELLITITGVPTDAIAEIVAKEVLYATHMVDPNNVVYYYNDLYINKKYPVYFRFHEKTDFSLNVLYEYDQSKIKAQQVEEAVKALFKPLTQMVAHLDTFSEGDAYKVLEVLKFPSVRVLNVAIINSDGEEASFVRIPKTRLPNLTGIAFASVDIGGKA